MKISYSNYPILKKLHEGKLEGKFGKMPIFELDKLFFEKHHVEFTKTWKSNVKNFGKEVNIISRTFNEASFLAKDKLISLYVDTIFGDVADFTIEGIFCVADVVHMVKYNHKKGTPDLDLAYYAFTKQGAPLWCHINIPNKYSFLWISEIYAIGSNETEVTIFLGKEMSAVIVLSMFKSYAQVETKELLPHSKVKDFKCKYLNDTDFKVTHLDSKWFTTLVKSDEFKVRGHFRLQPKKKDGVWTKELIYISEFKKSGYTAPARKLKNQEYE